ncbi:MAG: NYN domain-containing protein [Chloroflexota bacterium]|nr:NYN domain-containing protein [Chloroflexota bacterium]
MYPPDGSRPVQKGVDMHVALHMVRLAYNNAYDTAILVAGDADLVEAVRTVKDLGRQVECVYCPNVMYSTPLIRSADVGIEVDMEWLKDCLVEKEEPE